MNDAVIIFGIATLFVAMGVLLPLINADFGVDATTTDPTSLQDELEEGSLGVGIITSIGKMFSWTFGDIWWPIDLLLLVPLRIVLYFVVARNIWVGGGA
jgi:hypothetical protein